MSVWSLQILSPIHSKQQQWLNTAWLFTVVCLLGEWEAQTSGLDENWSRTHDGISSSQCKQRKFLTTNKDVDWGLVHIPQEPHRPSLRICAPMDAPAMWTWEPSSLLLLCTERAVGYNVLNLVLVKREAWGMTMFHRHRWCTRQFSYHVILAFLMHRGGSILIDTDCNFQ